MNGLLSNVGPSRVAPMTPLQALQRRRQAQMSFLNIWQPHKDWQPPIQEHTHGRIRRALSTMQEQLPQQATHHGKEAILTHKQEVSFRHGKENQRQSRSNLERVAVQLEQCPSAADNQIPGIRCGGRRLIEQAFEGSFLHSCTDAREAELMPR